MAGTIGVDRPGRWDVPFDSNMTDEIVDRILKESPFCDIDQAKFPNNMPLREIIKNDTRLIKYKKGDIVVHEGDYGNSAFFILSGNVCVAPLDKNSSHQDFSFGRQETKRKSWFQSFAQLWANPTTVEYRKAIRGSVDEIELGGGSNIRAEGDSARIFLQDVSAIMEKYKTISIEQGEFFGEIAALGRTTRTATIFVDKDDVELVEIKWQGLRDIRRYTPQIREHIDRLYRERSLKVHLQETPLFSHLTEQELSDVADQTQFRSYGDFDWQSSYKKMVERDSAHRLDHEPVIVEQGNYPNGLILIRAGFARLSEISGNGHRTVSYLGRGQFYGFDEIFHSWKTKDSQEYEYTLRGIGHVDVLFVPTIVIEKFVLPKISEKLLPKLLKTRSKNRKKNSGSNLLAQREKENRIGTDVLEFFVENRTINGTATMMINLDRCTRCDDCVRACASTHNNNPRFVRQGKKIENLMIGHACMQCQDPICMIGCPTGAIHRETTQGNVIINDSTCIGCTSCFQSCPYDNIKMVEVRDNKGEYILDKNSLLPIIKATKCDLCLEQIGGPACERACPHGALVRMDMRNNDKLVKWIKAR